MRQILIAVTMFLSFAGSHVALSGEPARNDAAVQTAPVRVDGVALFPVRGIAAHPARERAASIAGRIKAIAADPAVKADTIAAVEQDHSTDIMAGDRIIMSIFDEDAELEGVHRRRLATVYERKIRESVEAYRRDRAMGSILRGTGATLGATVLLIALIMIIRRSLRRLLAAFEAKYTARLRDLQAKSHDIVRTEWVWLTIRGGLRTFGVVLILLLALLYLDLVLRLFPWTRIYAIPLLELVVDPLRNMGIDILDYLPKLVFLIILIFIAHFGLRALKVFFLGIQRSRIAISGFEPEWAMPVYKVTRLGVIAFTVVVAYPYIPGSESPAFKGVSIFLGIVFSLGSSSTISNIIAGYIVIFRRAFKTGDRVKIGAHMGDVLEMRLQATHLRTIKNEEVIVPNSTILSTEVVNYSSLARKGGLILHTTVTIGYDTPWRQVHAMLLLAAERTAGLLKEPKPFVLQTALNDFYVSYELNAYTDRPLDMATIYSDLHRNIQDAFNEFGVQIMSPHYLGDPAKAKIVPKEKWHPAPADPEKQS